MRHRFLSAVATMVALTAGCRQRPAIDPKAPIIIISVDTLRSDHLPAYGYTRVETPAIDRFRADSILFERAYSQCPLTLVSHASVFTGLLPSEHGIRDNLGYSLDPKAKTLAELLKSRGYATGGAVSAVVLRRESSIARGFDFWDDSIDIDPSFISIARAQRSGDDTRAIAQKWIGEHKNRPFFFFFHIYEPHTPYEPVEPFKSVYGNSYDGEIATADAIVGRFLDYLRAEGLYGRSTILLMSDHGEGLGDHGEEEHGILLYRETLQVPLILKLPHDAARGTSVADPVQLIDIYPTIAQALGVAKSSEGKSLLDVADGNVQKDRAIYAETYYPRFHFGWSDLHSLIVGDSHYIHGPKPELYDVLRDPAESRNVVDENRRVHVTLQQRIEPLIHAASQPSPVDDATKQQLIALGYVGSTISSSPESAALPNPRDNIQKANAMGAAFREFRNDNFDKCLLLTRDLLRDNPNMYDIWVLQVKALSRLGRDDEAIESAKQALRLQPASTSIALALGTLFQRTHRLNEAEQYARLALKETPTEAHRLLADIFLERKDYDRAEAEATLIRGEQGGPIATMIRGRIALARDDAAGAMKLFAASLADLDIAKRKSLPKLHFYYGDALARLGRGADAEKQFLAEIDLYPTDPEPYRNLVLLYVAEGKMQKATDVIFSLEKAAPTADSYAAIAETLKLVGDRNGCRYWAARGLGRFPSDERLRVLGRG